MKNTCKSTDSQSLLWELVWFSRSRVGSGHTQGISGTWSIHGETLACVVVVGFFYEEKEGVVLEKFKSGDGGAEDSIGRQEGPSMNSVCVD